MADRIAIHIIDDDPAVREGLEFLLDAHDYAVTTHASAASFMEGLKAHATDCILTDVRMPQMNGLELVRRLKADGVTTPVIVMTGHGDIPLAVEAMRAGVSDFIEKPFDDEVLLKAIDSALATARADGAAGREDEARRLIATLSPREHDVLLGVLAGKANKVIGHELDISPRTVEIYRANLMSKTGVRNVQELMRLAFRAGL